MARITKQHKSTIDYQMDLMARYIKTEAHLPLETFLNLFFTAKQREQMDAVKAFVDMGNVRSPLIQIYAPSSVPDDMPFPEHKDRAIPRITLYAHMQYAGFHPRNWVFHPYASPDDIAEFERCVAEVTSKGRIMAMWGAIKDFYVNEAKTHEEMRYLFPGTVSILRMAGLHTIADSVENVHRRPPVNVDRDMTAIFRYMNQWFATQTLLETFSQKTTLYSGAIKDANTVTLRLGENVTPGDGTYTLVGV